MIDLLAPFKAFWNIEKFLFSEGIMGAIIFNIFCIALNLCIWFNYNPIKLLDKKIKWK
ncbi:hypothetical protein LCGC14_0462520 [marine sediment metagenome]|uniref:Uncharacterized protein n=1 Tax=marine sediment metagenome TaxID=412755 RepID=A0A0F9VNP5_9ZZZZ